MATTQQPKITLYWLNQSRAQRIIWLLEELKLEYEIKVYKRDKEFRAPPELKEGHVLGKSPVVAIEAPGEKRIVLAESGLIVEYLVEHFAPHLQPKRYPDGKEGKAGAETEAWLRYRYYMHMAEGSFMPPLVITLIAGFLRKVPFFIRPITGVIATRIEGFAVPEVKKILDLLESDLGSAPEGGPWICGKNLSGADILLSYPLMAGEQRAGLTKETYPNLAAYLERMKNEAGWKSSIERITKDAGEFDGLAPET